jgi:hypothetical protein
LDRRSFLSNQLTLTIKGSGRSEIIDAGPESQGVLKAGNYTSTCAVKIYPIESALARFHKSERGAEEIVQKFEELMRDERPAFEGGLVTEGEFHGRVMDNLVHFLKPGVLFGNHHWLEVESWALLGLDPNRFRARLFFDIYLADCPKEVAQQWLVSRFPSLKEQKIPGEGWIYLAGDFNRTVKAPQINLKLAVDFLTNLP